MLHYSHLLSLITTGISNQMGQISGEVEDTAAMSKDLTTLESYFITTDDLYLPALSHAERTYVFLVQRATLRE